MGRAKLPNDGMPMPTVPNKGRGLPRGAITGVRLPDGRIQSVPLPLFSGGRGPGGYDPRGQRRNPNDPRIIRDKDGNPIRKRRKPPRLGKPVGFDRDNLIGTVLSSGIIGGGGRRINDRGAGARGIRPLPPGYKYDEIDRIVPIDTPPIGTPKPKFDPNKPSAVMETERVNVQDPTLGGSPEREVPIPKERDTSPRGRAPFSPDERAMARDAFFEKMFSRADERKQQKAMRKEERMNAVQSMKDEDRNTAVDSRRGEVNVGGEINLDAERGGRRRRGRRMRRRDFTRRRSRMEGRRSRDERAAFRDRFVSTLRGGFFS